MWSVLYTNDDPVYWKTVYGPTGALEAFVEANKRAPTGGFVSSEVRFFLLWNVGDIKVIQDEAIHNRIFAAKRGGYEPCLNHYRALYRDLNLADENGKHVSERLGFPIMFRPRFH